MFIGNGKKLTYNGRLVVTGTSSAIPNSFTPFCKTDFSNLIFTPSLDGLLTFDEDSGVFEFLQRAYLQLEASVNFDTPARPERLEITPLRDQGEGYIRLNSRTANVNNLIHHQMIFVGSMSIEKGHKIKFEIKSNGNGFLDTETLGNGSIIPAAIIDFVLFTR